MLQAIEQEHYLDADGNPAGGSADAVGITILWQSGPLGRGAERQVPNGAFVETVIAAAIGRLEFYQSTKFACEQNESAIRELSDALAYLAERTQRREARGVEGTHEV